MSIDTDIEHWENSLLGNFDFEIPEEAVSRPPPTIDRALPEPTALDDLPELVNDLPAALTYKDYHKGPNPWDPRIVMDLALGVDSIPDILERYALTPDEFDHLAANRAFRHELALTIKEVRENGLQFKRKARVQADLYLGTLDDLVTSESVPAGVRLDAIKSVVRWGDLEPKEKSSGAGDGSAPVFNVQINF